MDIPQCFRQYYKRNALLMIKTVDLKLNVVISNMR